MLFQFTPLHERQHSINFQKLFEGTFQFTPLHERQRFHLLGVFDLPNFNSRLCMRGNVISPLFILPISYFNSRLCMRGNSKIHNLFDKIDIIFYQTLFFYSNFSESSLFFNSSSIFLINCIFLPAPMSHKKMYESHQRTHF